MDGPDFTVEGGDWAAPLNRVAIILDERGEFSGVVADSEVEFYVVQPSCKRDRVYRYGSGAFGPQHVQAAFDGHPVGHADDDIHGRPRRNHLAVAASSEASRMTATIRKGEV